MNFTPFNNNITTMLTLRFTENRFFVEKNPTIVNFPISFDMAEFIDTAVADKYSNTEYNLLSNICHDGTPTTGTYSTHLHLARYSVEVLISTHTSFFNILILLY